MCGFVFVPRAEKSFTTIERAHDVAAQILELMNYRGLSGRMKVVAEHDMVLGHVRLPIMNLSRAADQPMRVDDHLVAHVGEIFNYRDFEHDAISDTVVLAHMYDLGLHGFHVFDGFWGSVITTPAKGKAVVIVDYLAQKPVYWHSKFNVYASELRPLTILGVTLNQHYLSNVLKWGYDPLGQTPYNEVIAIPPGNAIEIQLDSPQRRREQYWDWNVIPTPLHLRSALTRAVGNRLLGDQPIAALVSGGLDSTIVYKLAEKAGSKITAFHVDNDEAHYAKQVCENIDTLTLDEVTEDEGMEAHQVPVDLGSVVPQLALSRAIARKGFHVVLSGDGADELFGGYRRAKEYDSQWSDTFTELPWYHLPRLDRIMMRNTIELRSPYLAPSVIKFALSLPHSKRTEKQYLRNEFSDLIPWAIRSRNKKPLRAPAFTANMEMYRRKLVTRFVEKFEAKADVMAIG
jgi:asparagine synthase (glutamine-hydrolysing)